MDKKIFWVGTGILVMVVVAAAAALILRNAPVTYHGSVINPAVPAADFSLIDQAGKPIRLTDYRGKYVLLFFGYSHCTDQCPASMAILAKARTLLSGQGGQVQVIFVATDPAHDTPQSMGEFVGRFDPTFMGATGSLEQLQPVWTAYGVTVADGGETHSSYTYLVDKQGELRLTYAYPGNPDDIAADLMTFNPKELIMRKALVIRFLICIAAGILIAIPFSELSFYWQGHTTSRPAKTIRLDIPAGTSAKVAQGSSVLPQDLNFVRGDTLVVNNQDSVAHTLGPLFIPAGGTASLALKQTGNLAYVCSFQPTKYEGLTITDALTLTTRLEGIIIAGVPLGILIALYSLILRPLKNVQLKPV